MTTHIVARLRAAGCVFAEDEARLILDTARTPAEVEAMVEQRAGGLPLEHVLGWAEFCGLRIQVDPGVFVPRHRSELLVAAARRRVRPGAVVVDLCCGTGAIGLAVVNGVDGVELHAADVDPAAVACARRNVEPVGGRAHLGDLDAALPPTLRGRVDVLVASPPYVPTTAIGLMPAEARVHEPRQALDGGADGLDLVRRLATAAPVWLRAGGVLVLELSEGQAAAAATAVEAAGLTAAVEHDDEGDATVVVGRSTADVQRGQPAASAAAAAEARDTAASTASSPVPQVPSSNSDA
ncbi:putative protein N(5)-glutamine methyltransferase [Jiangella asiatica]|uniref:peptide chain release factor N(5)-glutamine methyltransferase n=1 Tax=Jiangella asiatica TaxID=2530372 RepID=A0A4R5CKL8_9ACTN|nr:putative protein N(5)-glutamine methyltransferase [Jiangella asiatica]TDE00406.1 putative protein N(5)-glutamine methyltransferase [Jiangella asiatica]